MNASGGISTVTDGGGVLSPLLDVASEPHLVPLYGLILLGAVRGMSLILLRGGLLRPPRVVRGRSPSGSPIAPASARRACSTPRTRFQRMFGRSESAVLSHSHLRANDHLREHDDDVAENGVGGSGARLTPTPPPS